VADAPDTHAPHGHLPQPPPLDREAYARSEDGTLVYYNLTGMAYDDAHTAPLVMTDGIACDQYVWRYLVGHFARTRPVLRWNLRAHGRSGVPARRDAFTMEDCAKDLCAVIEDAGWANRGAVLLAHSMGVQVTLEFYRRWSRSAGALVLVCGAPGRPIDSFHDGPWLKLAFPALYVGMTRFPDLFGAVWRTLLPSRFSYLVASQGEINARMLNPADFMGYLDHASRLDVDLFARMLAAAGDHDASDVLPHVKVPSLVVVAENDTFTPRARGLEMAAAIPGAETLLMPGTGHAAPIELPELLILRLEKFLAERVDARSGNPPGRVAGP
jgi:pimeloyl-ACP methyl ester carboxylesterase